MTEPMRLRDLIAQWFAACGLWLFIALFPERHPAAERVIEMAGDIAKLIARTEGRIR